MLKILGRWPKPEPVGLRKLILLCLGIGLLAPAGAAASSGQSSNWAGYAVHRAGIKFNRVLGTWTQPHAQCRPGHATYSAVWVGLGGYSESSQALEQIGTELDCTPGGRVSSTAWYELIPAASRNVHLHVAPGDQMAASVTVIGNRVGLALLDLTAHTSFTRTLSARHIDVTSAEWIVEAPSECISAFSCQTLPLANFGSATFGDARAQSTAGHLGTVSDATWDATKIRLRPGGRRFVTNHGLGSAAGGANPSSLSPDGSSFSVVFAYRTVHARYFAARRAYIVH